MTVHGRADCYINPSDASLGRRNEEIFGNICDFLTGSFAQSLGIYLVAANWQGGTGGAGQGLGFWDGSPGTNEPLGPNGNGPSRFTWAVFRWPNAPRGSFDMLIAIASGSGQSLSPFDFSQNTGTVFGANNSFGIIGWACATFPSSSTTTGSNAYPWGGNNNIGNGTLASPVWRTGPNGGLAVFPRVNSADGTNGSTRNFLVEMHDDNNSNFTLPMRMHIIITEGSFTCVQDYGLINDYRFFHFGSYNPRPGLVVDSPYFMIAGKLLPATNNIVQLYNALTYGGTSGQNFNVGGDGGIAVPVLLSGSKNVALVTIANQNVDVNIGSFNSWINSGSGGGYDLLPAYVCMQYTGIFNGIMGVADYFNFGYGMVAGVVNQASSTVAFGQSGGTSLKVVLPWSGSSPGTLNNVRTGRDF